MKFAHMKRRRSQAGFTLLEMIIVISIILILVSIAIPNYVTSTARAKEAVLRNNLFTLRSTIDQYTMDKQQAPQSLDDLVSAGYLRFIPKDPLTGEANWEVEQCETYLSIDQSQTGICDVHSAANNQSSGGAAYSTW
ncbi:MAG: prepilin-type N-terminal cleavage/methylation domain-containing protein [Acidobacteriota bacterium]|nr:prepilin-type N-terminal cleavage/methylation domain-containing protein [Acidobacteriota bacterium]